MKKNDIQPHIELTILGNKIQILRKKRGLSLRNLAHKIGKEPQSIHRVEKGLVNPSYLFLLEVCIGLGINIVELFN